MTLQKNNVLESIKRVNWKLFLGLLVMGLCPTIYTTVRTAFLGQLPNEWAYSIAGQLTWVNLLYEIVNEAIILPLFFFFGSVYTNREEVVNRIKTGLIAVLSIYVVFSGVIILTVTKMLQFMAVDQTILQDCARYIRIESIANIFIILTNFLLVVLVTIGKEKFLYALTAIRLVLSVFFDIFFLSDMPFSMNLGVDGIGYSNIIVNIILVFASLLLLKHSGFNVFQSNKLSFSWIQGFVKVGALSGFESFVRNFAYIMMISRMVNMVGEQGTYWVANNFIWGWLLLPVVQLGEVIKQEVAKDQNAIRNNMAGYISITSVVVCIWIIAIPLYRPFMQHILHFDDVNKLFQLVLVLLIPYIAYAFQNIVDSIFYGRGVTQYMLLESVITNTIYYGGCFVAYLAGYWEPTLLGIALMFGFGNIFDSIISWIVYIRFKKKYITKN